jgi:hypothetical protein
MVISRITGRPGAPDPHNHVAHPTQKATFQRINAICYTQGMGKSRDPIKLATAIFDEFLAKFDPGSVGPIPEKDPHAQAAGRKGGLKGGKVRGAKAISKAAEGHSQ